MEDCQIQALLEKVEGALATQMSTEKIGLADFSYTACPWDDLTGTPLRMV